MSNLFNKLFLLSLLVAMPAHASSSDAGQSVPSTNNSWLAAKLCLATAAVGGSIAYCVQKRWIKQNRPQDFDELFRKYRTSLGLVFSQKTTEIIVEAMKSELTKKVNYESKGRGQEYIEWQIRHRLAFWTGLNHCALSIVGSSRARIFYFSPRSMTDFDDRRYEIDLKTYALFFYYNGQRVLVPYTDLANVVCKAVLDPEKDSQKRIEKILANSSLSFFNTSNEDALEREFSRHLSNMDYQGPDPKIPKKLPGDCHLISDIINFVLGPRIENKKLQDLILNPGEDFFNQMKRCHSDVRYLQLKDSSRWQDNVKAFWSRT